MVGGGTSFSFPVPNVIYLSRPQFPFLIGKGKTKLPPQQVWERKQGKRRWREGSGQQRTLCAGGRTFGGVRGILVKIGVLGHAPP